MNDFDWSGKKILILGFGREGQSVLRFLKNRWPDLEIGVADRKESSKLTREELGMLADIKMENRIFGENYLGHLREFDAIIRSPGINPRQKPIEQAKLSGVRMESATNLFFRYKKGRVIAVTGSKGKSTTASLIWQLLKTAGIKTELIGNIGKAALDYLANDEGDLTYVFEMSSYQLEDFRGGAEIAVLVSFFPEHLDYHGDLDSYFEAKMKLVAQPTQGFTVIYNAAQERLRNYFEKYARAFQGDIRVLPFNDGIQSKVEMEDGLLVARRAGKTVVREDQIKLRGKHNIENILAVMRVAEILKIDDEVLLKTLSGFSPLEHRMELVGEFKGITFYNDAISTTPESTMAAMAALVREKPLGTLIAGGLDRGYNFEAMAALIRESKITNVILLPETGLKIEEALNNLHKNMPEPAHPAPLLMHCRTMQDCVKEAYRLTPPGTICLLSCASPSYNLFKNFEERGKLFKESVRNLASG